LALVGDLPRSRPKATNKVRRGNAGQPSLAAGPRSLSPPTTPIPPHICFLKLPMCYLGVELGGFGRIKKAR